MVINQKVTGRAVSIPTGLIIGGAVSLAITIILSSLYAWMLSTERMKWEQAGYWIMAMLLICSFVGATVSCARIKRQRLLVSLLAGMVYMGILLSITALFFGGQYDGIVVTSILVIGASAAAGILGLKGEHGRKAARKKRRRI